jgi:hypothetical protein
MTIVTAEQTAVANPRRPRRHPWSERGTHQVTRVADPDSIGSVDPVPDPDSESGSVFGIRIRIQEGKNDPQK